MQPYFLAALWALVAYVVYRFVARAISNRRHAAEAERLGCKPAPTISTKFYGIDRIKEALVADKAQLFPDMCVERYNLMNDRTHRYEILGIEGFMTADPKNIQAVLATQFNDFDTGPIRRNNFFPLLGNGIFTSDGQGWEHSRAMMRPQFARDQVSDLKLEEEHVQNMMRALPVTSTGWTDEVDLQVLFFRLTLDSACEFLFGESVGSQLAMLPENIGVQTSNGNRPQEKDFAKAFDFSQAMLAKRSRFLTFYWVVGGKDFDRSNKDVHRFVDYFVELALNKELKEREMEKGHLSKKDKYVFLDALVAETRDPIELRSQLLNILLAGRDTTASLLGWVFYVLARRPDIYTKLRTAILQDFGTYEDPSEITYSKLKNCQYLQHVLNEALRVYAVVPVNSRRAVRDTTLPRGGGPDGMSKLYVRQGTQVDYSVHVMHHRKELWGQDADEFKPERWVGRRPGWEYLPFNGGPRICLGQQFALTEASYVTVRLLQRFERIENLDTEPVTRHKLSLTNCSGTGVKVRLFEAVKA